MPQTFIDRDTVGNTIERIDRIDRNGSPIKIKMLD
jgi:hypothetical protein